MSGGSFNYAFSHVNDFAASLADRLAGRDGAQAFDNPAVTAALTEIQQQAERLAKLMRAAEWLYSYDYGEESFLDAVREAGGAEPMATCACGDQFPARSYGAGFLDAAGRCESCDAAESSSQAPQPPADKGPWRIQQVEYPMTLASDDFEHDVTIKVSGDFGGDSERWRYARWLAGVLNGAPQPNDLQCLCGAVWSQQGGGWVLEHLGDKPYGPRWRHADGGAYVEVARGKVQFDPGLSGWQPAVFYRSESDGAWYARHEPAFAARFVPAGPTPQQEAALQRMADDTQTLGLHETPADSEGGEAD